jgi:hypothetical protein
MMNNYAHRPDRFLKPFGSFLLLCFLVFSGLACATPTTPTSDFIDNKDGTVTHKTTGMTWMRCAMGQTWNGATCTGTAQKYTYDQALALTTSFAGKSDWHLPTMTELTSIVERDNYNPSINTSLFPNSPSNYFWSASPVANDGSYSAWVVSFGYGDDSWGYKYDGNFVRLVRAGQCFGDLRSSTPSSDFIDNQDGTVTHKCTGLVWQRCSVGQTWNGTSCTGSAQAYTYDQAIALKDSFAGNNDWRLPNANELQTIAEYGSYNPAINSSLFPNTPTDNYFWSASPVADYSGYAWIVGFVNGGGGWSDGYNLNFVRLVRAGQCFGVLPSLGCNVSTLPTITFSTPSIDIGQTLQLNLSNLTPNGSITLHRKLSSGAQSNDTFKANAKGTLALTWYMSSTTQSGDYSIWLDDNTSKQQSIAQTITVTANPVVTLSTNRLSFNATNKTISAKFKTTAALSKDVTTNLYIGFQLPDGTVLYDDGSHLTTQKTPRLANTTINTIKNFQPALAYKFGKNALSGSYAYWAVIENSADNTILAETEIDLSYCGTCTVTQTLTPTVKTRPQLIDHPRNYPVFDNTANQAKLATKLPATVKNYIFGEYSPFAQYKSAMSGKQVTGKADLLLDVVLKAAGYDVVKKVKKQNDYLTAIKPFLYSLNGSTGLLPDATVNQEQDTAAMISVMQILYDKFNIYNVDFSDKVNQLLKWQNDYSMNIRLSDEKPNVHLEIDVYCQKPFLGLTICLGNKKPTLTIYELLHFECSKLHDRSSCNPVPAKTTTPVFADTVISDVHSSGYSYANNSIPMGVYKLVVSYNNKETYFLCNALEADSYCRAYMP